MEQGLKRCMLYIFILSVLIISGVFATDWWFTREGDLLNDTLVGIMIGAPIGWFGACLAFYTTLREGAPTDEEDETDESETPPGADN